MSKKTIFGGILVVLIIAGIVAYAAFKPTTPASSGAVATQGDGSGAELPPQTYTEHAQYYDIAANYATSTSLAEPANTAAVSIMRDFIADTISQFKTDGNFANLTPQDIQMMNGQKDTLQITYLIGSSTHTVSYIFNVYEDTGGAHGNTTFKTFTFDTQTGALLSLSDVFAPGSNYLNTLSSLARLMLPAVIGSDANSEMINSGTTAEDSNFQSFFFDNTDFVILFDPYAVAAYSDGPQTLRIPASQLSNILKSQYQ